MIQNYDKISNEMKNLAKLAYFEKFIFIQQSLTLYVFLITSCKSFHSKILSYEKVKND